MERRKESRFTIRQAVELQFGKERFIHLRGYDLSKGGVGGVSDEPIEFSAQVYLMIEVSMDDQRGTISGEAQVNHCTPRDDGTYFVGLEFVELSTEAENLLSAYIELLAGT